MAKKSTITDIAKQLGVSTTLVSFVLNGKSKQMRISDEMTNRVLELTSSMNFKMNFHAKRLRSGKTQTIGLIIADISNPFFAQLARFIEIEAAKSGYKVIFMSSDEQMEKFVSQLETLKNGQIDGFILAPPIGCERTLNQLKEQKIPFVLVDRTFKDVDAHCIIIDNYLAAFKATKYLAGNGRKRIALLNVNDKLITMHDRARGFMDALADSGLDQYPKLIKHLKFSHEKEIIMEAIKTFIQNGAEAILFTTNKLGITGVECIHELGLRIPEDMSVFSFDDTDVYRASFISISAIQQPLQEISSEAVRILISVIENPDILSGFEKIELKTEFILRKSCM
jgi:LacI family transcriptional regulator